ncbi:hypothetical protein C8Q72DRAFT_791416 [Fomitopsis betulina]|nr:hypothetical protein C8Q72DRAFT_791416 [Fomitopsis betulina]
MCGCPSKVWPVHCAVQWEVPAIGCYHGADFGIHLPLLPASCGSKAHMDSLAQDELPKKPAWMATTADEYDNGQMRESQDEEESEVEVGDGSSDEDVQIWTGAPQLCNRVKKDAKSVVEDTYGLKNLPAVRRVSAALFLLKYNPQGNNSIPNFVFDNIELQWSDDDMDIKVRMNRREALMKSAKNVEERFLSMPDNLIVFVCNVIESALADIATGVHQFTNKVYAPKWVNLMDLLKVMKARAPEVHVALKMFLGDSVRKTVAAQQAVKDSKSEEDGNEDGDFMSWKDIEVTMLPDRAGPSGSQDVSERPVGGTLPTTSALLPLASSAPASPVPASSVPASSAPASSIRASAVQAPAASSLNTMDIEEETELDS